MDEQTQKKIEELEENIRILEMVLFKELLRREVPTTFADKEKLCQEYADKI